MTNPPLALAQKLGKILSDRKAEAIVVMDLRGLSSVTDYYVIATALNTPHLKALADEMERVMGREGRSAFRRAGTLESEWLVVDYLDVVVHLFTARMREYYALERLWRDAKSV